MENLAVEIGGVFSVGEVFPGGAHGVSLGGKDGGEVSAGLGVGGESGGSLEALYGETEFAGLEGALDLADVVL